MQLPLTPLELPRELRATPLREHEIIAARIASARYWRRRRTVLKLRAALFGRRKAARVKARSVAPMQPARAA